MRLSRNGFRHFAARFVCFGMLVCITQTLLPAADSTHDLSQLKERVPLVTSTVTGSPEPPRPYRLKRVYKQLKFDQPVCMQAEPGSDRIFIVQLKGKIVSFKEGNPSAGQTEVFDMVHPTMRRQPYNMTFHPNYTENGLLYVFTNVRDLTGERNERISIYQYQMDQGSPRKVDPKSEKLIISWLSAGHDGGGICFGPDGYLYASCGDATTGSDVDKTGQDITDLPASIIRIDVDHPDPGKGYSIPRDNPFVDLPEARHEIWAFGFRAPWRMSFDMQNNRLWVGDVGQDVWEMIHIAKRGGNYGWSITEGGLPFMPERKKGPGEIIKPVISHHHTESRSITGGYVYRGHRLPELREAYIYCDYATGKVWGLRYEGGKVTWSEELADSSYGVATFGLDHTGELYHVSYSGELLQLEPNPALNRESTFPAKLSETGLYESVPENKPAAGVIRYEINAPGWHDGAREELWLAIPEGGWINKTGKGGWNFQDGAVALQTLSLELEPGSLTRIETRLLTRQDGEWQGYSYLWNDEQTEATLVEKKGRKTELAITHPETPGQKSKRTWNVPSRADCMSCHSRAANFVLSLNSLQLNRTGRHADSANQIAAFDTLGFFKEPRKPALAEKTPQPKTTGPVKRVPVLAERIQPRKPVRAEAISIQIDRLTNPYDETASLDLRARSYLHTNCSHCHVKDGGGNAKMELEITRPAYKTNIMGVLPLQGNFNLADGLLVAPGEPSRSVLLYRISKLGSGHMPHVGSYAVDAQARDFFWRWIQQITPDAHTPTPSAKTLALQKENDQAIQFLASEPNASRTETSPAITRVLSNPSGAMKALHAYETKTFSPAIAKQVLEMATTESGAAARDLFERFLPEEKRLKRLGTRFDIQALLARPGNIDRGKELFFNTAGIQCKNCHRVGEKEQALGPDLAKIGTKYTREQILESILEPSKKIDQQYKGYLVGTDEGLTFSGLIVKQTDKGIVLRDNELKDRTISEDEIDFVVEQKKSIMPEQLFRDLTAEQAADLLAWLASLK